MNTIELTITKEDLETANYRDNSDCPIARALKRAGMNYISCGGFEVSFRKPYFFLFYKTYYNVDIRELSSKIIPMMDMLFAKKQKEPETFTYILKY